MKNTTSHRIFSGYTWNVKLPYPRSLKTWLLVIGASVGLVVLTYGLARVFQIDNVTPNSADERVEMPNLDWRQMISVLTRYGERPGEGAQFVEMDVLMATPQYFAATRRTPPGQAAESPSIVFYLTETTHVDDLPSSPPNPILNVGTQSVTPANTWVMADSPHHRTSIMTYDASDLDFGSALSMSFTDDPGLSQADNAFEWQMPLTYSDTYASDDIVVGSASGAVYAPAVSGVAVLAVLGGLLAAMWPCLFQLTAYFIPAMAGMSMHDASKSSDLKPRLGVVKIALFFVLGFTVIYTLAGAVIGYGSQQLSSMESFYTWQRYLSIGAGILLMGMALRVAANARAPLVCKMPILSKASGSGMTSPWESMLVGVAFATGCMTCFGSAILIGMVLYVGLAGSPIVGATLLFLFSLGMGVPLVIGAMAMARVLPLLFRLEKVIPWMGLASAILIAGYGLILVTGNFMTLTSWLYKLMGMTQAL